MRKVREWEARTEVRAKRGICSLDLFDSPDPPQPDPAIGQAALQQAETGKEMLQLGREELQYRRERDAMLAPTFQKIVDTAVGVQEDNRARAAEQWKGYTTTFKPLEEDYAAKVKEIGSPEEQERAAGRAVQDVQSQFDVQDAAARRNLSRYSPSSGAFQVGNRLSSLARAGATSAASTSARENARMRGLAAVEGAAKFGRGLPSTGIAADTAALNAGSGATSALGSQANIHSAGTRDAAALYGGGVNATNSAGNMLVGQFNAQNAAYQNALSANRDAWGGLGDLVAGGIQYGPKVLGWLGFKEGGQVKRRPRMLSYVRGGEVLGPGGPTDDAVPAVIEGEKPAALSDGEYVIKASSVAKYGPRLLEEVNQGTALIVPRKLPRRLSSVRRAS